jgi:hypothetical protein
MSENANKTLKDLQMALSDARENDEISEPLYRRLESRWSTSRKMGSWDFVRSDDEEPTAEPGSDYSRPASVVQEVIYRDNGVLFGAESVPGAEDPRLTHEERSSKDIEAAAVAEEREIEVEASNAHAFAFCLRCPRVVVALFDAKELPDWLSDSWDQKHGIISICCGGCRRPAGFWARAGKKSSKYAKVSVRGSSDIAEGMEAVNIDPEKLTGEVGQIARAIVGSDVGVLTLPTGGTKYIDATDFMEKLSFEDILFGVNVTKFRAGERRRQELLEPFRGGFI